MSSEGSANSIGFVFAVESGPVLTIYNNGSVKLGSGFYPDQAGEMAAKAMINYLELYTKDNPIFNVKDVTDRILEKIQNAKFCVDAKDAIILSPDVLKKILFEELSKKTI